MKYNIVVEGWKALKKFEQSFRVELLGNLSAELLQERVHDAGVDYPCNHAFTTEHIRAWGQEPNKVHLIHQVLSIPKDGKIKWTLTSFHSIMKMTDAGVYQPKSRYFKQVKFVVNPVQDGHRFQVIVTTGNKTKIYWGYNQVLVEREFVHSNLRVLAESETNLYLKPQDIHHVLQWFMATNVSASDAYLDSGVDWLGRTSDVYRSKSLGLGGPGWSRILKDKSGSKDILNAIYDPKGVRRIPKNAFGGVGEIRSLDDLAKAVMVTRAFRSLDPHSFAEVTSRLRVIKAYSGSFVEADKVHWFVSKFPALVSKSNDPYLWGQLEDTARMLKAMGRDMQIACLNEIRRNQNRGMEWAHDFVAAEHSKIGTENKVIDIPKLTEFEGTVNDDIVCVVPKCTHDLIQWGAEYNICIGSYADQVHGGSTYCMGFRNPHTGIFYGFAEVIPWDNSLSQLLGKYNKPLPDLERLAIENYLLNLGVSVNDYWGKPVGNE